MASFPLGILPPEAQKRLLCIPLYIIMFLYFLIQDYWNPFLCLLSFCVWVLPFAHQEKLEELGDL